MFNRIQAAVGSFFNSTTNTMFFALLFSFVFVFGIIFASNQVADHLMAPTPTEQAQGVLSLLCTHCMPDSTTCHDEMKELEGRVHNVNKDLYNACINEIVTNKCSDGLMPSSCYNAFAD